MTEIKKGDVVGLKSGGGVLMTVEDIGDYSPGGGPREGASCIWFDNNKIVRFVFDRAVLRVIDM